MGENVRRSIAALALVILAIAGIREFVRLGPDLPWLKMYDFAEFYCAGAAVDAGRNPYDYEPLHTCEHRYGNAVVLRLNPALALPAPQPPYDMPLFAAVGALPYDVARTAFALMILAAVGAAAYGLSRLGIAADVAALALLPAAYVELSAGQVVPVALVALVWCGVELARRRDAIAGVLAAFTAIEPHVGLVVASAVLLFVPRARIAIAVGAAALALAGMLCVGPGAFGQYLTAVLPAHAAAEVALPQQYSFTYAMQFLGVPSPLALLAGDLSYITMWGLALWVAPRAAAALGRRELIAYVAAAFAVTGGSFIHSVEMPLAIPAALVFATQLTGRSRVAAAAALCALAVPWLALWSQKKLLAGTLFVCAALLVRLGVGVAASVATVAAIAIVAYAFELRPPTLPVPLAGRSPIFTAELVQRQYALYAAQLRTRDFGWFAIKLPTWASLGTLLVLALRSALPVQQRRLP